MDRGLISVLIQPVHPFVLQVYKLAIVIVSIRQPVDSYVRVLDYNFAIVRDIMIRINAMVCSERIQNRSEIE